MPPPATAIAPRSTTGRLAYATLAAILLASIAFEVVKHGIGSVSAHAMASSAPGVLSPRAKQIVDTARELLEEEGLEGLSMRRLADRLGLRAPSLYKHFADKQALEAALISGGLEEQAEAFEHALRSTEQPLRAIATAYRRFAHDHPHLYRLMTERPLQRERLVPGVEDRAGLPATRRWERTVISRVRHGRSRTG